MKRKKKKINLMHFCITLFIFSLPCVLFLSCSSVPLPIQEPVPVAEPTETPEPVIQKPEKVQVLEEQVVFHDDFSDITNGWETNEDNYIKRNIENGFYIFENTHDYNSAFSSIPIDIAHTDFYIIESSIEQIAGTGECSYGISWGFDRDTNSSYFILLYENYILYGKQENRKWSKIINWKQFHFIKKEYGSNKIALKIQKDTLEVFVNEKFVYDAQAYSSFGDTIGFILFGKIKVKADFLLITKFKPMIVSPDRNIKEAGLIITPDHEYLFEKK